MQDPLPVFCIGGGFPDFITFLRLHMAENENQCVEHSIWVTLGDACQNFRSFAPWFVRKTTNRSGTISVVVVSRAHGKFTEVKGFGVAKSEDDADELFRKAQSWLRTHDGQQELDFDDRKGRDVEETVRFLGNINSVLINGTQLLLNLVYDGIGFNQIPDEILRHLVIAR